MNLPLFKVTFDLLNSNKILLGLSVNSFRPTDQGYSVEDDNKRKVDPTFFEISIGLFFLIINIQIVAIKY
jgi:hypothetical protein